MSGFLRALTIFLLLVASWNAVIQHRQAATLERSDRTRQIAHAMAVFHEHARRQKLTNHALSGDFSPASLPADMINRGFAACADARQVATYTTSFFLPSEAVRIAHHLRISEVDDDPSAGVARSGRLQTGVSAVVYTLPCTIPDGAAVIQTQMLP